MQILATEFPDFRASAAPAVRRQAFRLHCLSGIRPPLHIICWIGRDHDPGKACCGHCSNPVDVGSGLPWAHPRYKWAACIASSHAAGHQAHEVEGPRLGLQPPRQAGRGWKRARRASDQPSRRLVEAGTPGCPWLRAVISRRPETMPDGVYASTGTGSSRKP